MLIAASQRGTVLKMSQSMLLSRIISSELQLVALVTHCSEDLSKRSYVNIYHAVEPVTHCVLAENLMGLEGIVVKEY